jgi:Flp pilus assembly protein TadG
MVEFVLAGIPAIFVLISIVQMGLGMWQYHTLQSALQQAGRYVVVRGRDCVENGNSCSATLGTITKQLATYAVGMTPQLLSVSLIDPGGTTTSCNPLNTCFTNTTVWPPAPNNAPGMVFTITAHFTFHPAIGMVWPGNKASGFGSFVLGASTTQEIMF